MVWGSNDKIISAATTNQRFSGLSASWGQNDIVQQPTNTTWGSKDISVSDEAMGLIERSGKRFYNIFAQTPENLAESFIKIGAIGIPKEEKRIAWLEKQAAKGKSGAIEQLKRLKETGGKLPEAKPVFPSFKIPTATTSAEALVDIGTHIAGTIAQIVLLRKVLPGTSEPVIWEIQNLMTGGKPGTGAAFGAMTGGISKLNISQLRKVTAEAAGFYALARIEGAKPKEAAISAAIPLGLHGAGLLKRKIALGISGFKTDIKSFKTPDEWGIPTPKKLIKPSIKEKYVITPKQQKLINKHNKEVTRWIEEGKIPEKKPAPLVLPGKPIEKQPSKIIEPTLPSEIDQTNKQLLDWSATARRLRKEEIVPAVHKLRQRQAARGTAFLKKGLEKGQPAWDSLEKSIGGYKDKANIPEITPPNLTDGQWEGYAKIILDKFPIDNPRVQFTRTATQQALKQLRLGKIPTNRQFELLEPILGQDTTLLLYQRLSSQHTFTWWDLPKTIVAILKSPFSLDVQFARQASSFTALEPFEYGKGLKVATKAYLSETFAKEAEQSLINNPNHAEAAKYINFLSRVPYKQKGRAEWFQFGLGERLAEAGKARGPVTKILTAPFRWYGKWLLASERSMVVSTDSFFQALWDKETVIWSNTKNITPVLLETYKKNYGDTINAFMKILRAKSPSGKEVQRLANYIVFSPSMTVARPYQFKTLVTNKGSRAYAAELIVTNIAKTMLISSIAHLVGNYYRARGKKPPIDGEINPLRGNWGKIKVKNTWSDFGGGDAQYYRTIARLAVGSYAYFKQPPMHIGEYRVQKPTEVLSQYGTSRETAALGFAKQLLTGRDYVGKPIPRWETLVRSLPPEMIQNTWDTLRVDGVLLSLVAAAASTYSAGINTYPTPAYIEREELQDKIAQQRFNKDWNDLNASQQIKLNLQYRKQLEPFEKQIKVERYKADLEIILREQKDAEKWILKQLPKDQQNLIKSNGINVRVSRNIGDWRLNDERFKEYQRLTAQYLKEQLNKTTNIQVAINIAKSKARAKLRSSIGK